MYDLGPYFKINTHNLKVNEKATVKGSKYRIQVLTDRIIRFEYSETGTFVDLASANVINRTFPLPMLSVKEDEAYVYIATRYMQIKYQRNAKFSEKTLSGTINYSKKEWFYTQKEVRNYGGTTVSLDNTLKMPNLNKGLFNPEFYFVFDDSNSLLLDENSNVHTREANSKDIYLFAYSNDFNEVIKDYFTLTGYPEIIPRYSLGNWWSRDIPYSDEHIISLLNKFKYNNIPISVFLLDKDWSYKNVNLSKTSGFTFNPSLFQNPKGLIDKVHEMNVRLGVIINPRDGIFPYEKNFEVASQYIKLNKSGNIDFKPTDARFMDLYFKMFIHPLESLGVDLFWNDYDNLDDLNSLFILNDYMKKDSERDGLRSVVLSRNANFAPHRYPILYSGHNIISFDVLKILPLFNITASNIGVSYWSHDVGGSVGGIEDSELYIRSVQFGVFSPFLRFNTEFGNYYKREPWRWDFVTNNIVSYYLRLRNQIIPYLYTEIYHYHKDGLPLIRPLYYDYPDTYDNPSYINEYYFGSSMLISPIVKESDPLINRTIQRFFIPEGVWYDFKTGKKYAGNKKYVAFYTIEDYPVFVKAGGIIPTTGLNDLMSTEAPKELEIHVFPGQSNSYSLYEDDGITKNYLKGNFTVTNIDYNYLNNNYTLIIRCVEGKSDLLFLTRDYKIRFRNTKLAENVKVYSNDTLIPFNSYLMDNDFVIEVKNVPTSSQLTINCAGSDIEINAMMLINDDIDSILSDLKVPTNLKDTIASVLFSEELPPSKKRIEIRKLRKKGLDARSTKIFLRLIEYMSEV
ncbi:MAG: DUF5110 domain-containing protein [Bacilli bacterium]|nr:DUF5110 domain-containing protein [Bacilli bacterium]